jgi:site-specific recombinase XerD
MVEKMRGARKYRPGQFRPGEYLKKERPDGQCEGPGCSNVVPGGVVGIRMKHYFCSERCDGRYHELHNNKLRGLCDHCGEEVRGTGHTKKDGSQMFCSREHVFLHYSERAFGKDNPFRPIVEDYIELNTYYNKNTLPTVKVSLSNLASFAHGEGLTKLEQITPQVISRFIKHERARGLTGGNFIGHTRTFFGSLIAEGRVDMANPVIPRIHSQRGAPTEARPYSDKDLAFLWNIVESSDDVALKLAFAIGKECGLRVGEVCNIRLHDVDQDKQEIFVRLPTKNRRTRTVPYHSDVAKYLELWLAKRSPACATDHLLHSKALVRFNTGSMSAHFKKLLGHNPAPAREFKFHRLRHSWATRLMNNGMELAVLKVLGGWESWNSMQKYIRVLDVTVKRQYEESYRKLQEQLESEDSETLSLLDFAAMNAVPDVTAMETAA